MKYLVKSFSIWGAILVSDLSLGAGATGTAEISQIAFQSEHLFLYSNSWNNPNNCEMTNAVVLQKEAPNFDKAYTLLLAAYMAGKNVSGYSDGCITWDGKTYNTIRGHKYLVVN